MPVDPTPNRLSPVHNRHQTLNARFDLRGGWLIPEVYTTSAEETALLRESVGLLDLSARGKLILKGANSREVIAACFGKSPSKPGDVSEIKSNDILAARLTPDQFLILASPGAEKVWATSLEVEIAARDTFASVSDLTSGLVGLLISGPKSTGVMSKLCAIPFNSREVPNLCVVQSSFAKVRGTIIRHDRGGSPAFELFADCSYGEYLWDTILDAGREFGMQPVGWNAIGASNQENEV